MTDTDRPALTVGDRCWLLHGVLLYTVTIAGVRVVFEGESDEFSMYRVTSEESSKYFEPESQHRSDLFLIDRERDALIDAIGRRIESLQDAMREIKEAIA